MTNFGQTNIYNCSYPEYSLKLLEYWIKHKDNYPKVIKEYLDVHLLDYINDARMIPDALFQIYAHLKIIKLEYNFYEMVAEFYCDYFSNPYDKEIIDVGCGCYPITSEILQKRITANEGKGNITAYDPDLVITSLKPITLKKELFTDLTKLNDEAFLFGMFPCDATELMITKALKEKKELCIQLCNCVPEKYKQSLSYEEWINLLYSEIVNNISSDFKYDLFYLDRRLRPVLALKRK